MTSKNMTAIVLRLFSLWMLVQVLLNLSSLLLTFIALQNFDEQGAPRYFYLATLCGFLLLGLIAVYAIWRISTSVLAHDKHPKSEQLEYVGQAFLLQLGGGYFVISGLAALPASVSFLNYANKVSVFSFISPLAYILQVGIGVALLVNPSHWAKLFLKLRGRA